MYCQLQVEAKSSKDDVWEFIRICHLNIERSASVMMGLLACAPTDAGGSVVFTHLKYKEHKAYSHSAE